MSDIKTNPMLKNTDGTFSMKSLMSMSSLADEMNVENIQDRVR